MTGMVLLSGSTGFVGRQILKSLEKSGIPVRLVVREGKQHCLSGYNNIESILTTEDLFAVKYQWWEAACKNIVTVIHAAWYAEPGQYLQSPKNLDCLAGTLQLAKGAARAGVKKIVGVGTCFEYDLSGGMLSVETPLLPVTPYASAKAAAFIALSQWLPAQGVEFAWCRLFYLYGEGEDKRRLVPYIRAKLEAGEPAELTSGNQIRDFLDVADAGGMIADVALGGQQGAVNICSGTSITIRHLAEQIADEFGRRDLLHFGVRPEHLVDPPCVVGIKKKDQ